MFAVRLGLGLARSTVGALDPGGRHLATLVLSFLLQVVGHALGDAKAAFDRIVGRALAEEVGHLLVVNLNYQSVWILGERTHRAYAVVASSYKRSEQALVALLGFPVDGHC